MIDFMKGFAAGVWVCVAIGLAEQLTRSWRTRRGW